MRLGRLIAVLASVAALTVARPASAVTITYDFWLNAPNGYPVDHLVLFAANATEHHVYLAPEVLQPSGVFQLTHTVAFEPTDALVLGITERDKDDWWDIVVFTSDDYAAAALGKRYSEMFLSSTPGYLGHNFPAQQRRGSGVLRSPRLVLDHPVFRRPSPYRRRRARAGYSCPPWPIDPALKH